MADKDELETRRWFRQRLAELGEQYPQLKDPAHQQRLTEALAEGDSFMPRTPTGRPVGRPPGSGQLGVEGQGHKRLTVRLPSALYHALEAVTYTREAPDLARTVRTALEHYLVCPQRQQIGNVLPMSVLHREQNAHGPELRAARREQSREQNAHGPELRAARREQTENVPEVREETLQVTIPPYDASKYYLGKLCPQQHNYSGTGQSLRRLHNQGCRECERLGKRTARVARRQQKGAGVDGESC